MISQENLKKIMEIVTNFKAKHKGKNVNTKYTFEELFLLGQELDPYLQQTHGLKQGGKTITYYNYASISFVFSLIDDTFGYTYSIIDYTGAAAEANKISEFNLVSGLAVEISYSGNLIPVQTKRVPLAVMSSNFKTIEKANSMNIDKTIGRALAKSLAFNTGFGLHVWFAENDYDDNSTKPFTSNQPLVQNQSIAPSGFKANIDSVGINLPQQPQAQPTQPTQPTPMVQPQPVVQQPINSYNPFENGNKFMGNPQPVVQQPVGQVTNQQTTPITTTPIAQVANSQTTPVVQQPVTPTTPVEPKKTTTKKVATTMTKPTKANGLSKLVDLMNVDPNALNYVHQFMVQNNLNDLSQIDEASIQTLLSNLGVS